MKQSGPQSEIRNQKSEITDSLFPAPLLWALAIVLLASLPYIVGLMGQPIGTKFTGFTYNIDDSCVYMSWIRQIADGGFLIRNQFTSDPQSALQFNVFFLVLGLFARITHLSPAAVLHIARVALGIGLLAMIWKFAGLFLKKPAERLLIVPMVGLASGFGWMLPGMSGHQGPVDLWQPEAITFLSIYLNPLFLIGQILMAASLYFLYRAKITREWRRGFSAGLMLLLLANIHTYDVLTVGAVWAAYMCTKIARDRRVDWRMIGQSAFAASMSIPALLYQFYLYTHVEAFQQRVESAAPSPEFWAYLMGYGLLLPLAIWGAWILLRERSGGLVVVVWAVVGFAMPYLPFAQQRKLVMGLHIPLAILGTVAVVEIARGVGPKWAGVVTILIVAAMIPSNLLFMNRDIQLLQQGTTAPHYRPYLTDSELDAMRWLRNNSERADIVLAFPGMDLVVQREKGAEGEMVGAPPGSALFVPVISGNRVHYGHWSETPGYGAKLGEWLRFVDASTPDDWRLDYLNRTGALYIIYFSHADRLSLHTGEDASIALADLSDKPYLRKVFESGDAAVYRVR